MNENDTLRQRIRDRQIVFGAFYKTNSPLITEIFGYSGFDFIIVDCEHSGIGYESMENIIRTADSVGLSSIIRVPCASDEHIFHALDAGATGVQLPNLSTAGEVEESVKFAKYYPLGNRGLSRATRAARYSFWTNETPYVEFANEKTLVSVHIENKEMVEQIEQVCALEQVDVVFVGPADLSQSLGIPGKSSDPRVVEMAQKVFDCAKRHGKAGGIFANNEEAVKKYINMGATYILYGSDADIFAAATKELNRKFQQYR